MAKSENKPKLSDIARQNNTAKAARFSSTMIPAPPKPQATTVDETPEPPVAVPALESLRDTIDRGEADFAQGRGTTFTEDELKAKLTTPDAAPADKASVVKTTRARRSGSLAIDEVINGEPPKGESYPRQVRISERHHKLLRKLAFTHEKTQNHILYNLLDLLEQADQRDQQKGD
ncbi:hypothetical protein [Spirosoma luteum]|uniref:hypothetical protein n=1 Tax=Spirosoma luteum TaxID=431553 RepID=UPI000373BCF1|nr:hypothetical protein [Spirosoma luteum]